MVKLKNFDESKIDEYSIEELQSLINEVDMTRSVIREKLTAEMAEKLKDDKFDAFSFFGQRKLRKKFRRYKRHKNHRNQSKCRSNGLTFHIVSRIIIIQIRFIRTCGINHNQTKS